MIGAGTMGGGIAMCFANAGIPVTVIETEAGALERSNVKPVLEMTRLMDVNRTYTMVSGVISRLDDLRGTAIRRLADVA